MKKKILIGLFAIVLILLVVFISLSIEEAKYSDEKYTIDKNIETEEDDEQKEIKIDNSQETEEIKIVEELEDLTGSEYKSYSLFNFDELKSCPSKEEGTLKWENEEVLNVKANENFNLFNDEEGKVSNYYRFFNDKGNVSGCLIYLEHEYSEDFISQSFVNYDEAYKEQSLSYYDFGEIQEINYKGLKGVYNKIEFSHTNQDYLENPIEEDTTPRILKYTAYFNYNGQIIHVILNTYKNCSYGQKTFEELLDTAISFT